MKCRLFLLLLFLCPLINVRSQIYITDVSIGDVENQVLIPHQTVIITGNIISQIQPADRVKVPVNATVISGAGKYLFPGLTDAHVHFSQSGGLYTRPDAIDLRKYKPYEEEIDWTHDHMEEVLRRYLHTGITTVIDVGTTVNFLKQREQFRNASFAPTIYMAGPLLTTYEPGPFKGLNDDSPFNLVTSTEDAKNKIQQQLVYHPDLLKIWYIVGQDTSDLEASARNYLSIVKTITEEAHKNNLKMAIHATERITAQLAVENGCDYLVHSVEDEIVSDDFVQLLKKKNVILCPTLVVHDGYINTFGQKISFNEHDFILSDPDQLGSLLDLKHLPDTTLSNKYKRYAYAPKTVDKSQQRDHTMRVNLKKLSDAGVTIATGTDAGNIGTLHASSYMHELNAMQESGMTNWQILTASTLNGAKVLGKEKEFGTVTAGKKASLILLNANPAEDLDHLAEIDLVINNGTVIDPDTLIRDTPEDLVQRQLNGYNMRNLEAFLEPYGDDVEIYNDPDKLLFKGKDDIRKLYSVLFDTNPTLHCEMVNRVVSGNKVIDQERVQLSNKILEAEVEYHIEAGKIRKVYFKQ
jgi:imidazolonepropionase-like amidohydrolase